MHRAGRKRRARQERMVVPLHYHEDVARTVLRGHIPWLLRVTAATTDLQTATLPKCVESEALVSPEGLTVWRFDGAGRLLQKLTEELPEGPFANEADAGAVRLVEHWQARAACLLAHSAFLELSERHQRLGEVFERHRVQEVALVLGGVSRLAQLDPVGGRHEPRVVPRRKARGAEPPHVVQGHAEFDFTVTEHVRIGRAASALLAQEVLEHTLPILGRETHSMQRDRELPSDRAGVLKVLGGRAIGVIVLFPVAHEEAVHVPALLLEQ